MNDQDKVSGSGGPPPSSDVSLDSLIKEKKAAEEKNTKDIDAGKQANDRLTKLKPVLATLTGVQDKRNGTKKKADGRLDNAKEVLKQLDESNAFADSTKKLKKDLAALNLTDEDMLLVLNSPLSKPADQTSDLPEKPYVYFVTQKKADDDQLKASTDTAQKKRAEMDRTRKAVDDRLAEFEGYISQIDQQVKDAQGAVQELGKQTQGNGSLAKAWYAKQRFSSLYNTLTGDQAREELKRYAEAANKAGDDFARALNESMTADEKLATAKDRQAKSTKWLKEADSLLAEALEKRIQHALTEPPQAPPGGGQTQSPPAAAEQTQKKKG